MEEIYTPPDQVEAPQLQSIDGGIDLSKPLKPFIAKHSCNYDCSFLDNPLLHRQTAEDIAHAIALRLSSLARGKGVTRHPNPAFKYWEKFFGWLFKFLYGGKKTDFKDSVMKSLAVGEMPAKDDWQMVVNAFRTEAMRSKVNAFMRTENKFSKHMCIHNIRAILKLCSNRGIFPAFVLKGIRNAHKHAGKRKSLGDLRIRSISKKDIERLIGGYLLDNSNEHDIVEEERKACIRALASSGIDITGKNDAEIIDEIKRFNTERLVELRRCAESDFCQGWETYQGGQRLLEECHLSYEDDMRGPLDDLVAGLNCGERYNGGWSIRHPFRDLLYGELKKTKVHLNFTRCKATIIKESSFHKRQMLPERNLLARILTVIDGRYGISVPLNSSYVESPILQAVRKNRHTNFSPNWLQEYLSINIETMMAAQIILLIDSGLNTEVVDQLTVDCVKDTDDPLIKQIWGVKKRGGKIVDAYVRINDPAHKVNAIEVISRVKEMTRRFRKVAAASTHQFFNVKLDEPNLAKKLFIRNVLVTGQQEKTITLIAGLPSTTGYIVRSFRKRHPSIGAYDFTLGCIRPTVALLDTLDGRNIETMRDQLKHAGINTTSGYVVRTVSRMVMEQKIREFQKVLEAIMIFDIPGAAEKLGYTTEEYKERLIRAERTGLGTICDHLRPSANGQDVSKKRNDCDPIEDCPECPLMRVFPALKENLTDAFLFRNWIKENEGDLKNHNPVRWQKVWVRWLAITEGVIDKAKTSHVVSRIIFNEAEALAIELGADGFLPLI